MNQRNKCILRPLREKVGIARMRGFTLPELLIVVIIIAVLTAVALPMYKHTVLKSRFSGVMPLAKAVADAQEVYYLGSGEYATTQDRLDIVFPTTVERSSLSISQEEKHNFVMASRSDVPNVHYIRYQEHSQNFPSEIHCEAKADDEQANWLCEKGLKGEKIAGSITQDYNTYVLEGTGNGNLGKTYYNTNNLVLSEGDTCIASKAYACSRTNAKDGAICEVTGDAGGGTAPCDHSTFTNGSICKGNAGNMPCRESTFVDSSCEGTGDRLCRNSDFTNSSCKGTGGLACTEGTFTNSTCEGNCTSSDFTNSTCEGDCSRSTYANSTCTSRENNYGCVNSSFTNSTCYAKGTGGNSTNRSCGGTDSTYDNSTCYNQSSNMWGCGKATYTNGSKCYSNENGGCGGGAKFNTGSKCYGNASGACGSDTYTGGSVCHANVPGACNNNTYESGSYCVGNHCPVGTPAGDEEGAFTGHCWDGNGNHGSQYCS